MARVISKHSTTSSGHTRSTRAKNQNMNAESHKTQEPGLDGRVNKGHNGQDFEDDPETKAGWSTLQVMGVERMQALQRGDPWPKEFAKEVRTQQASLTERIQKATSQRDQSKQQFASQMQLLIAVALSPTGSASIGHGPTPFADALRDQQPLFIKSSALVEESKNLIRKYHELTNQKPDISDLRDWNKEFARHKGGCLTSFQGARKVAQRDVEGELSYNSDQGGNGRGRAVLVTADEENLGRRLLNDGNDKADNGAEREGWGDVAKMVKKGAEKFYEVVHN